MIFSEFKQRPWNNTHVRIALAITYSSTWVSMTAEEQVNPNMHAWVAMVINAGKGQGKRFVFWDSDFQGRLSRAKERAGGDALAYRQRPPLLLSRQQDLINAWSSGGGKVRDVWVGGKGNEAGEEKCLILTLRWLERLCKGDFDKPQEWTSEGLRGLGFTLLDKK
jgi:hypothetical protein